MFLPKMILNDRYELFDLIARGGMGEVWLANDKRLERTVAIKTTIKNSDKQAKSIFYDEAKTGAALIGHPNIVSVLDYGIYKNDKNEDEIHYIVMEYIEGMNLNKFISEIKAKLDDETYYFLSLFICWEVCKALDYSHKKGIMHRDIKPLNIFLSNIGVTRIGDFGLARYIDAATRTHTVVNFKSPAYAAPEQWRDEKYNTQTDLYQLGCTIYHLLTGKIVFNKSNIALMSAHLNDVPVHPNAINKKIPKNVSDQILNLLKKKPNERESLWNINDVIAKELQQDFVLSVTVDKDDDELVNKITEITDFSEEILKEQGTSSFNIPDFSEVLSEGLKLLLIGFTNFKIYRMEKET